MNKKEKEIVKSLSLILKYIRKDILSKKTQACRDKY